MKLSQLVSFLSAAAAVSAAPVVEERSFGCLNTYSAQTIVNQYISILENTTYQGSSPQQTAQKIIDSNYVEYSDSILSLEKAPVRRISSARSNVRLTTWPS